MEDSWELSARAFHAGRHQDSLRHLTPLPSSPYKRSLHLINAHAISSSSPPPPPPPHPTSPSLHLLSDESALTLLHNTLLTTHDPTPLDDFFLALPRTTLPLLSSLARNHPAPPPPATLPAVLTLLRAFLPSLPPLPTPLRLPFSRWALSLSAALELRAATALTAGATNAALALSAADAARALRALPGHLSLRDAHPECYAPPHALDAHAARADYLVALAHAAAGDVARAYAAVLPRARLAVQDDRDGGDGAAPPYLPVLYLCAALAVKAREKVEGGVLELCVRKGYRVADCLALMARGGGERDGAGKVAAWARVADVDFERPAGLFSAAQEFGRKGEARKQVDMLECLEKLVAGGRGKREEGVGVMRLGGRRGVGLLEVKAMKGRALCDEGEFREAIEVLSAVQHELCTNETREQVPEMLARDVALDLGLAYVAAGDVEIGVPLLEGLGVVVGGLEWRGAAAALGRAEGLLRKGETDDALRAVREGIKCLRVGMVDDCAAERLLRGIAYHNLGVLRFCNEGGSVGVDEAFAAAQAAMGKCGAGESGVSKEAHRMMEAATLGRCVAMWKGGRAEDAAAHWVAKRGERGGGERVEDERETERERERAGCAVMVEVPRAMVGRMDEAAGEVWRTMEARRRLNEAVGEVSRSVAASAGKQ